MKFCRIMSLNIVFVAKALSSTLSLRDLGILGETGFCVYTWDGGDKLLTDMAVLQ